VRLEIVLPLVVSALYFITAAAHFRRGQYAIGAVWASYAVANVFMVIGMSKH
jgi:hypothetical protein